MSLKRVLEEGMTFTYSRKKGVLGAVLRGGGKVEQDLVALYMDVSPSSHIRTLSEKQLWKLVGARDKLTNEGAIHMLDLVEEWLTCTDPERGAQIVLGLLTYQRKRPEWESWMP